MKKLFNFKDCISLKHSDEDYIVIYPIETDEEIISKYGHVNSNESSLARGYLYAAEKIITSIGNGNKKRAIPVEDRLSLPLLLLYFCAFEFCLKLLNKKLNDHKSHKCCHVIKDSTIKLKNDHDLCKLLEYLKGSLPEKNKLHYFKEFEEIEDFIKQFYEFGITSESTRYCFNMKQDILPLHSKQTYINYRILHKNVENVTNAILYYLDNQDFDLCEQNEFTMEKIKELTICKLIMKKERRSIKKYLKSIEKRKTTSAIVTWSDVEEEILNDYPKKLKFCNNYIKRLSKQRLAALTLGLYFTRSPEYIDDLTHFERLDRAHLEEKILERINLFDEAYSNLNSYIQYLEKILETNF